MGTPCPNCGTKLEGPWCYKCGQLGEDFHRSAAKLFFEAIYEALDVDGRIWNTFPDLLFRPGRLTRAYLDGHRAPQIPPLRLFLVFLVLLFIGGTFRPPTMPDTLNVANEGEALKRVHDLKNVSAADKKEIEAAIKEAQAMKNERVHIDVTGKAEKSPTIIWLRTHIKNALAHQDVFWQKVQSWAERFAFLMLPISAVLLSILFIFQRRFYLFDHIIFSMHSLSFLCLLLAATFALERYTIVQIGAWPLAAAPVHLFAHMRGVYRTSILGTLFRMFLLFIGSVIGLSFLLIGLLWVAVSAM